ncbi:MAG: hypothetical protein H6612_01685 [Ignavibacteriales bacterium]|nr:hypothetical protein [Ignavibacteriales bacterium]
MKNTIVYALTFILAFIGTTAGIYILNKQYVNMFKFDFRDAAVVEKAIADSLATMSSDSLMVSDSLLVIQENVHKKNELKEHLSETKSELEKAEQEISNKDKQIENLRNRLEQQNDGKYDEWLKSTIKLYEEMAVNKAGELLKTLPEEEARDLIYAMKKKKAAEILSSLDTETVKKLTRAQK